MKRYRWLGLLLAAGLLAGACGRSGSDKAAEPSGGGTATTAAADAKCDGVTLEATDTGVTADTITIQVMADIGSPLAPGLFQGNVDAVKGFEGYINDMSGVAESALIGVPHPDFGEVGVAVVIAKSGAKVDAEAIIAALKSQLANFKIPKKCFVVAELPRNTMGKVQKNLLREQYKGLF